MIFGRVIPEQAYWIVGVLLVAAIGAQQVRVVLIKGELADQKTALATEKQARAEENDKRSTVALNHKSVLDHLAAKHAEAQQTKENEHATTVRKLEDDKRAGIATASRLRSQLTAFTTAGARPGETCPATLERSANRLQAVGSLLAEGVDLVTEGREIVQRRDAEVARLLDQIALDRATCSPVK